MVAFLSWYILITVLGWLTFPLAYFLFPALADRGYTLSRAFGLLLWGYIFWLFASFNLAQNDIGGLLLGLVLLGGLSAWAFVNFRSKIIDCLRENLRLIITAEILFLLAFGLMAFVRSTNPETATAGGEKWMEVAFINAILHSPTFPPHDPWLSGYAISYYYFGYVMTAMLAKFTSVPASVAHNLMLALIFGLSAIGAYGLLYNLLVHHRRTKEPDRETGKSSAFWALFAPLFLLIVSNLEGLFEILHRRGIGWTFSPDGTATSSFWKWLDLQSLSQPPALPLQWTPDYYIWWWRASRVVMDYDLMNRWMGDVIDEFPFFSYLLGDLHPHVLAMPFNLLAIAVALNVFFGGWRGKMNLFFGELRINKIGFFTIALVLGGLAFLNTWDILFAGALIVFSYALVRVCAAGWSWERIEDMFLLGVPLILAALVLYLPFFVGFSSQASGILPNFMWPTRGADLWVAWGTLFVPLFAYLIYLWRTRMPANWSASLGTTLGILIVLLVAMFALGFLALELKPQLVEPLLQVQQRTAGAFIADSMIRRLKYIGGLLTLLALLAPAFAFLFGSSHPLQDNTSEMEPASPFQSSVFVLLLIALGVLLILVPDFVYLRDNFLYRINTVFKFYYQAWILLSLVAAFGVAVLWSELRGLASTLYTVVIVIVIGLGLVYPVFSLPKKTDNFKIAHPEQRTLDGAAYLANIMPDDYQAIQFMQRLDPGVVAEAVGGQYSEYARVATFTGMPTVLGWPGHESQWRDSTLQGTRAQDIETLYTTNDWTTAQEIIDRYHIRYVYVGNLERSTYRVNEEKFNRFLKPVFEQGSVTIYEVPQ
jgi:YYY domain-containing protein